MTLGFPSPPGGKDGIMIWLLRGIGLVLYIIPVEHPSNLYLVGVAFLCLGLILETIRVDTLEDESPYPWFHWIALLLIGLGAISVGLKASEFFDVKDFRGILILLLGTFFSLAALFIKGHGAIEV